MANFSFDSENHRYLLDGLELKGVTTILKTAGLIQTDFYTEEARERGKKIHDAIYLDVVGGLLESDLEPEIKPYFEAWIELKEALRPEPLLEYCERSLYHPDHLFAGCPDIVCRLNNRVVLIDTKSGCVKRWVGYQTAGYDLLLTRNGLKVQDRFALKLDPSLKKPPRFKLIPLREASDEIVFLSALNICRAQEEAQKSLN